jgi:hypothetical protein
LLFFKNSQFFKALGSLEALPKMKNVLYGFMAGDDAILSEKISDQCLLDIIYEMIGKTFPRLAIPKPRSIIRYVFEQNDEFKVNLNVIFQVKME